MVVYSQRGDFGNCWIYNITSKLSAISPEMIFTRGSVSSKPYMGISSPGIHSL